MDMAVAWRLVEDDVRDPHQMTMLANVPPAAFHSSARGLPAEIEKDISQTSKGQFPLEKVTAESLGTVLNGATLIGVDPGMKSLVTAVPSDNPADNVQLTGRYEEYAGSKVNLQHQYSLLYLVSLPRLLEECKTNQSFRTERARCQTPLLSSEPSCSVVKLSSRHVRSKGYVFTELLCTL